MKPEFTRELGNLSKQEKYEAISFLLLLQMVEDDVDLGFVSRTSATMLGIQREELEADEEDREESLDSEDDLDEILGLKDADSQSIIDVDDVFNIARLDVAPVVQTNDNKIIDRWLPRLDDRSAEVREKAAICLSDVATRDAERWIFLIDHLLKHARIETSWPVVCNGILCPLSKLPRENEQWVEPLLSVYIQLARKADYVTGRNAYSYICNLINDGFVGKAHPQFPIIVQLAEQGEKSDDNEIRAHSLSILDWIEDSI